MTTGRIGILNDDGSVDSIHCHTAAGTGQLLNVCYSTEATVRELLALGDIFALRTSIGKTRQESYNASGASTKAARSAGEAEFHRSEEDYKYLFKNGTWLVNDPAYGIIELTDEFDEEQL